MTEYQKDVEREKRDNRWDSMVRVARIRFAKKMAEKFESRAKPTGGYTSCAVESNN